MTSRKFISEKAETIRQSGSTALIKLLREAESQYHYLLINDDSFYRNIRRADEVERSNADELLVQIIKTYRFRPTFKELEMADLLDYKNFLFKVTELGLIPSEKSIKIQILILITPLMG